MQELAPELRLLDSRPANTINVYLLGDVLIDAGTVLAKRRTVERLD